LLILLFLALLTVLVYTYVGYALLLEALWRTRRRLTVAKGPVPLPVSLVIPAYNEEQAIQGKLQNLLSLDFPRDRLEIVVVSDASTDETDAIVRRFADQGVTLVRLPARAGKIAAYETVLPELHGEIIVFSDATSILERHALMRLIENLADPSVGCVGAQVRFVNPQRAAVGSGVNAYWDYESLIRRRESDLRSLVSVSGTLYAVRRSLYPRGIRTDLADDLIVPLHVAAQGSRTVFEPAAICVESTTLNVTEEMAKRTRITIQNIRGLVSRTEMLNVFRYGLFAVFLISHKLLRLLVPIWLLLLLAVTLLLAPRNAGFAAFAGAQLLLYAAGLAGYLLQSRLQLRLLNVAFYFSLSNLAIFVGILRYFKGARVATWETLRRSEP
jgi:cellulose synthase/poly-beta-1,6-N-acetylglucosamine synthase-like glycosyltransferase